MLVRVHMVGRMVPDPIRKASWLVEQDKKHAFAAARGHLQAESSR